MLGTLNNCAMGYTPWATYLACEETAPTGANDPADPKQFSSWPDGDAGERPRSACLVITRDDGGPIGGR